MDVSDERTAQMIATVAQEWSLCPLRIKQRAQSPSLENGSRAWFGESKRHQRFGQML